MLLKIKLIRNAFLNDDKTFKADEFSIFFYSPRKNVIFYNFDLLLRLEEIKTETDP